MECKLAERLRTIALASMARELRMLVDRRSLAATRTGEGHPDGQVLVLLRRDTDHARKALRHHIASCGNCQSPDKGTSRGVILEDTA